MPGNDRLATEKHTSSAFRGPAWVAQLNWLIARPRNRIRLLFLGVEHPTNPKGEEARAEG
jgi:hypothetical protein